MIPAGLDFTSYDFAAAGEPHRFGDYAVGEKIDHVDGVTLTDPEHMLATRLWQNTAKVHFNTEARPDGNRLDLRRPRDLDGARPVLQRPRQRPADRRRSTAAPHVAPAFAGDTVYAWSEVLDKAETCRARRRRPAPAPRGDQGPRRVDDAARRRREVRRRRAARPRLLGPDPASDRRSRACGANAFASGSSSSTSTIGTRSRPAASRRPRTRSAPSRAARRRS